MPAEGKVAGGKMGTWDGDPGMEDFRPEEVTAPWAAPLLVPMLSMSPPSRPGLVALVGAGAVHPIRAAPRSCSSPLPRPTCCGRCD